MARRLLVPVAVLTLLTAGGAASAGTVTQTVADGTAVAFSLRPQYDEGGADPLKLYIGYSSANVSTPEPEADGQASWYNLAILETGLFLPPEQCTPEKNLQATLDGAGDLEAWLSSSVAAAVGALQQGQTPGTPTLPGPRHPCTERFPGFAQSRYPATTTIPEQEEDNYLDKPTAAQACREDPASSQCSAYTQGWPVVRDALSSAAQDGSFVSTSTAQPSQRSEAVLLGAGAPAAVSIGVARSVASARLVGGALVVEATSRSDDVCFVASADGCALHIDQLVQHARVVKRAGRPAERSAGTVLLGVHGSGLAQDLDAASLGLDALDLDLGGGLHLAAVSRSGSCGPAPTDPALVLADAGGLLLTGKDSQSGQGGGVLVGGACARARVEQASFDTGAVDAPPEAPLPTEAGAVPPAAPVVAPAAPGVTQGLAPVTVGGVRTVTRSVTRYVEKDPLAWRTARWWGPLLALLVLLALACRFAPDNPLVAPLARSTDRFARRFLRG